MEVQGQCATDEWITAQLSRPNSYWTFLNAGVYPRSPSVLHCLPVSIHLQCINNLGAFIPSTRRRSLGEKRRTMLKKKKHTEYNMHNLWRPTWMTCADKPRCGVAYKCWLPNLLLTMSASPPQKASQKKFKGQVAQFEDEEGECKPSGPFIEVSNPQACQPVQRSGQ